MGDDNNNGNGAMRYDINVDGDNKEVDGVSMWRSFRRGTIKASSSREPRGLKRRRGHRCRRHPPNCGRQ
jgi:hypothetical protein